MLDKARAWARTIKRDVVALWIAARDPRVPWYAKAVAAFVVAYALSPIDLIPDFIPLIGYLDDLVIVPLGIVLAVRLIPGELMLEFRGRAARLEGKPKSQVGAALIVLAWIVIAVLAFLWLWPFAGGPSSSSAATSIGRAVDRLS